MARANPASRALKPTPDTADSTALQYHAAPPHQNNAPRHHTHGTVPRQGTVVQQHCATALQQRCAASTVQEHRAQGNVQQPHATAPCNSTVQQHSATAQCSSPMQQHRATAPCNSTVQQHSGAPQHCNRSTSHCTATALPQHCPTCHSSATASHHSIVLQHCTTA